VYAINKFRHYIIGYEVFIHIDHSAIKILMNKPITNGRITRWFWLLKEFNITIVDRPRKENLVAYFLSRIHNGSENDPVDDSFPDEHLFAISNNSPWFTYIAYYLSIGKLMQHLSSWENKQIFKLSANYSWIGGDLFCTRPDLIIRICVCEDVMFEILRSFHDGPCSGHFVDKITTYKVLHQGYY